MVGICHRIMKHKANHIFHRKVNLLDQVRPFQFIFYLQKIPTLYNIPHDTIWIQLLFMMFPISELNE